MAYKDKEKQREACRIAKQRQRLKEAADERLADVPIGGMTSEGMTALGMTITPLDVYSAHRWEFLQSWGYVWHPEMGVAMKDAATVGVTVPGDPGYEGMF